MYYLNPHIKDLVRVFDQNERAGYLRLDLNENPGGLPEDVVKKVLEEITPELLAQYPETKHFTEVLAKFLGTNEDNICLVNGSSEGIRYIIQAFTSENGRIVGVTPSYFMFQVYSEMYQREFIKIPYNDDLSMDIDHIIDALSEETQLLILLNPNNPMGNVYSDEDLEKIFTVAREKKITVLVDEAYHYYYKKTCLNYALKYENFFVTRTFSKLCSLAGCRLGYVIGHPNSIKYVQKLCTPHNTNVFGLKFAEAVIETPGLLDDLINKYIEGRNYLIEKLDKYGYEHKGEAGNFIFIKSHTDANTLVEKMKNKKRILIKVYPNVGRLGNCLRVTIGEIKYMETFIHALCELDI